MSKKITIALSERAPITIVAEDWPLIAESISWNGEHRFQSFDEHWIRVREHKDGRRIVYGYSGNGQGGGRPGRRTIQAGYLIASTRERTAPEDSGWASDNWPDSDETIRAIRRVAGAIGDNQMADEVIADLPAEELA